MTTLTELLPESKSGRKTIRWTPAGADVLVDGLPLAGTLAIEGKAKRDTAEYTVTEFPTAWGRGFQLSKLTAGTDAEAEGYACLIPRDGAGATCECRGFLRWNKPCKHIEALQSLVANNWI
jgi:hypothetical protein